VKERVPSGGDYSKFKNRHAQRDLEKKVEEGRKERKPQKRSSKLDGGESSGWMGV
jgi:hypothetical protein